MKRKLALNFKDIPGSDLNVLAYSIIDKMTGNEFFPNPGPLLGELIDVRNKYNDAAPRARSRDKEMVSIKNDFRFALIKKLKQLAEYVTKEANGNETALISSGFDVITLEGETKLGQPTGFKIIPGANFGEIIMKVKRVEGARSYMYQYTPDPLTKDSVWVSVGQVVYTEVLWRYVA